MGEERSPFIRILDYLKRYPDTSYRDVLLKKLFFQSENRIDSWFTPAWLQEFLVEPFNQAGRMPEGFIERWANVGEMFVTDLNGDGEEDFIVAHTQNLYWRKLYWLHGSPGSYQLTVLPISDGHALAQQVPLIEDLNHDGVPELVYRDYASGASDEFSNIFIISWQNGRLQNMVIGDNGTQNGEWQVEDTDQDGLYELIKWQGGPGSAGFCCALPVKIDYRLIGNEYIPVRQVPVREELGGFLGEGVKADWQFAKMMQHTNHYAQAIEYLDSFLADIHNDPYQARQEVIPYTYFQLGMTYLLMDEPAAAQRMWQSLAQDFPEHPVTLDVLDIQPFLQTRDGIWQGCAWLRKNKRDWPLSEERRYIFAQEAYYPSWADLCDPMLLFSQWSWTQTRPIAEQLTDRALAWQSLSNAFDLNKDGIADPIGQIQISDRRNQVWVFLTQPDGTYEPFYAKQPYPPEAIYIWTSWGYDSAPWYLDDYFDAVITDENQDGNPEIRYGRSDGNHPLQTEWIGHRFEKPGNEIRMDNFTVPDLKDEKSLANVTKKLFYDQDFEAALSLLDGYDSNSDPSISYRSPEVLRWAEAGSHYLRGLAYSYLGENELAQLSFATVIRDYSDALVYSYGYFSWADLAREKSSP